MTPAEKSRLVKSLAADLGFDLAGIAPAAPPPAASHYRNWLAAGYAGSMAYLHRNVERREDPASLLPGARSIICVAMSYGREDEANDSEATGGRVARYARGTDYHVVIGERLRRLLASLRSAVAEPFEALVFVDTGPVLERQVAAAAGLGWIGKNTLLLHERLGSYLLLGEAITTLELAPDQAKSDHCGNCIRCLEACPTQAFPQPGVLDARRCIAYLTIEHRSEIDPGLHAPMGDWVFGCDICQEVCPFNAKAPAGNDAELMTQRLPPRLALLDLLNLTAEGHRELTDGTASDRARREMWRRNAAIALGIRPALTVDERDALEAAACEEGPAGKAARAALVRHGR